MKQQDGPDLHVWGSGDLLQTLMKHDLVDVFWLMIHPVTLGSGKRLFAEGTLPATFTVTESIATAKGVMIGDLSASWCIDKMIHKTIQLYSDKPTITVTTYVLDDSAEMLNGQNGPASSSVPAARISVVPTARRSRSPCALPRWATAFVLRYSTYYGRFQAPDPDNMPVKPETIHPAPARHRSGVSDTARTPTKVAAGYGQDRRLRLFGRRPQLRDVRSLLE